MPELPEVETTRAGIEPHILGQTVAEVVIRDARLRWPVPLTLKSELTGHAVESVSRRSKYLLIRTAVGTLIVHLGMSGSLRVVANSEPPGKHDHADFRFGNGLCLRFNDPRRFGCLLWVQEDPFDHKLLRDLGPEPLTADFGARHLYRLSRGRRVAVKSFIMDASMVVGVGNIYANESLYRAGISPVRAAGRISASRYENLTSIIKEVLGEAIAQGGTTLRDFVGSDGKPGYFRQQLAVYGRGGMACLGCGEVLTETRLGQRSTVYCKRCQR